MLEENFDWGGTLQEVGGRALEHVERFKIESARPRKMRSVDQLAVQAIGPLMVGATNETAVYSTVQRYAPLPVIGSELRSPVSAYIVMCPQAAVSQTGDNHTFTQYLDHDCAIRLANLFLAACAKPALRKYVLLFATENGWIGICQARQCRLQGNFVGHWWQGLPQLCHDCPWTPLGRRPSLRTGAGAVDEDRK